MSPTVATRLPPPPRPPLFPPLPPTDSHRLTPSTPSLLPPPPLPSHPPPPHLSSSCFRRQSGWSVKGTKEAQKSSKIFEVASPFPSRPAAEASAARRSPQPTATSARPRPHHAGKPRTCRDLADRAGKKGDSGGDGDPNEAWQGERVVRPRGPRASPATLHLSFTLSNAQPRAGVARPEERKGGGKGRGGERKRGEGSGARLRTDHRNLFVHDRVAPAPVLSDRDRDLLGTKDLSRTKGFGSKSAVPRSKGPPVVSGLNQGFGLDFLVVPPPLPPSFSCYPYGRGPTVPKKSPDYSRASTLSPSQRMFDSSFGTGSVVYERLWNLRQYPYLARSTVTR